MGPTEEAEEAVPQEAVPQEAEAAEDVEVDGAEAEDLAIQTTPHRTHVNCTGNLEKEVGHVHTDIIALGETSRAPGQETTEISPLLQQKLLIEMLTNLTRMF